MPAQQALRVESNYGCTVIWGRCAAKTTQLTCPATDLGSLVAGEREHRGSQISVGAATLIFVHGLYVSNKCVRCGTIKQHEYSSILLRGKDSNNTGGMVSDLSVLHTSCVTSIVQVETRPAHACSQLSRVIPQ